MSMTRGILHPGPAALFATLTLAMVTGCATSGEASPDKVAETMRCPPDLIPSCVEYNGKKLRCYCGSKSDLEDILEPYDFPFN